MSGERGEFLPSGLTRQEFIDRIEAMPDDWPPQLVIDACQEARARRGLKQLSDQQLRAKLRAERRAVVADIKAKLAIHH